MRTTINLPDPLLENAKQLAQQRSITVSELIEDALRRHMAEVEPAPATAPFRLHTVKGKLVNPNLNLDRTSVLIVADDIAEYSRS